MITLATFGFSQDLHILVARIAKAYSFPRLLVGPRYGVNFQAPKTREARKRDADVKCIVGRRAARIHPRESNHGKQHSRRQS